jgi:hypothetical protein
VVHAHITPPLELALHEARGSHKLSPATAMPHRGNEGDEGGCTVATEAGRGGSKLEPTTPSFDVPAALPKVLLMMVTLEPMHARTMASARSPYRLSITVSGIELLSVTLVSRTCPNPWAKMNVDPEFGIDSVTSSLTSREIEQSWITIMPAQ